MTKILQDAGIALSILEGDSFVENGRIGVLGHSYGGNTALFQSAVDDRIRFTCSSGAVCSFRHKMASGTPLEFALILPGIYPTYDFEQLLASVAPRKVLVVSAQGDKYSMDADQVVATASKEFSKLGADGALEHRRYSGEHALTQERFEYIVNWVAAH